MMMPFDNMRVDKYHYMEDLHSELYAHFNIVEVAYQYIVQIRN